MNQNKNQTKYRSPLYARIGKTHPSFNKNEEEKHTKEKSLDFADHNKAY